MIKSVSTEVESLRRRSRNHLRRNFGEWMYTMTEIQFSPKTKKFISYDYLSIKNKADANVRAGSR
jgi:hypothetical protein